MPKKNPATNQHTHNNPAFTNQPIDTRLQHGQVGGDVDESDRGAGAHFGELSLHGGEAFRWELVQGVNLKHDVHESKSQEIRFTKNDRF